MRFEMTKMMLIGMAVSSAFAAPAFAQDGGPWVAIVGGYDNVNYSLAEELADDEDLDGEDARESGLLYGVAVGYDAKIGGMLLGVEAEANDSTASASQVGILDDEDELEFAMGRDLYVGARLGFPIAENLKGFVKAGYTNAQITSTYTFDEEVDVVKSRQGGYRLGAGLELDMGKPFARLEYRYSNYGNFDDSDIDVSRSQVAAAVGFRF